MDRLLYYYYICIIWLEVIIFFVCKNGFKLSILCIGIYILYVCVFIIDNIMSLVNGFFCLNKIFFGVKILFVNWNLIIIVIVKRVIFWVYILRFLVWWVMNFINGLFSDMCMISFLVYWMFLYYFLLFRYLIESFG